MHQIMIYFGAALIIIWGIAHLIPTKSIVSGFGELSADNRRILTMEWIAEGMTLCFIGTLVFLVAIVEPWGVATAITIRLSAAMLLGMAILSLFTGARTSILPMRLCPAIKTMAAILFFVGA